MKKIAIVFIMFLAAIGLAKASPKSGECSPDIKEPIGTLR